VNDETIKRPRSQRPSTPARVRPSWTVVASQKKSNWTLTPAIALTIASAGATVPLVGVRIGYAEAFGLSFTDIDTAPNGILWGALLGIALIAWGAAMVAVLLEPIFRPSRAKLATYRNIAAALLAAALSTLLARGEFTSGDAATFAAWTAGVFYLAGMNSWIADQGYAASVFLTPLQADRRIPLLFVSLAYLPMAYAVDIIVPDGWGYVLTGVLLLALAGLTARTLGVSVIVVSVVYEIRNSRSLNRRVIALMVLGTIGLFLLASLIWGALPMNDGQPIDIRGLFLAELLLGMVVALQFPRVRKYVDMQRRNLKVTSSALLALGLIVTTAGFYYWGQDLALRQQEGSDRGTTRFLGLQKPWACLTSVDNRGGVVEPDPSLVLGADGSSYLLWRAGDGTRRVSARGTTLTYVASRDVDCD
jgi:hypothetical protein